MKKNRVVLFASGNGSNAIRLMDYFLNHPTIEIASLITNNKECGAVEVASKLAIHHEFFSNDKISKGVDLLSYLEQTNADYLVLVGFLRKIPSLIIDSFSNRIINLHPSLLPRYGGKGMFGDNVHKAVLENKEEETGITIHKVNSDFDKGERIAQFFVKINTTDNLDDIRAKIKSLEYNYLPCTIEQFILNAK